MKYFLGLLFVTTLLSSCGSDSKSQDSTPNIPPVAPIGTTNGTSNSLIAPVDMDSKDMTVSTTIGSPIDNISGTPQNAAPSQTTTIQSTQSGFVQ